MTRDVRILTFTSLYPSVARPRHGIFIESRLRRLVSRGGLRARVIAPVPWFPFTGARWGEYARMAATPATERREGIEVRYPRYPMLPRIGMGLQPQAMAQAGLREARDMLADGEDIDLIDAHYLYPDGVAAASLARQLAAAVRRFCARLGRQRHWPDAGAARPHRPRDRAVRRSDRRFCGAAVCADRHGRAGRAHHRAAQRRRHRAVPAGGPQ